MSEETENKPTQAPSAPFRRRRPSRRRSGRRNNAERGPGAFNESDKDNPGGPRRAGCPRGRCFARKPAPARRRRGIWLCHRRAWRKQIFRGTRPRPRQSAERRPTASRTRIRRRHHRDFRQRLWFSARRETQLRPDAAGHFRHPGNRAALPTPRRNVDLRRDPPRQSRPAIDSPAQDQRRRADQVPGSAALRRTDHDQPERTDQAGNGVRIVTPRGSWI